MTIEIYKRDGNITIEFVPEWVGEEEYKLNLNNILFNKLVEAVNSFKKE